MLISCSIVKHTHTHTHARALTRLHTHTHARTHTHQHTRKHSTQANQRKPSDTHNFPMTMGKLLHSVALLNFIAMVTDQYFLASVSFSLCSHYLATAALSYSKPRLIGPR